MSRFWMTVLFVVASGLGPAAAQPGYDCDVPLWRPTGPPERVLHAMAYDSARDRWVMFGGAGRYTSEAGSEPLPRTWEHDGTSWHLTAEIGPPMRNSHAMVYDPDRGVTVLFGGRDEVTDQLLGDTWEYDGRRWRQVDVVGPPARRAPAVAYDPDRDRVVLFGGAVTGFEFDDTWEYDGQTWTPIATSDAPRPRSGAAMTHDPVSGGILLHGGVQIGTVFDDTWLWDGASWTELPVVGPESGEAERMVHDPSRGVTVLLGFDGTFEFDVETWEWDGVRWSLREVEGPPVGTSFSIGYDSSTERVRVYGGVETFSPDTDGWASWDGASWTTEPPSGIQPRSEAAASWDRARGRLVMFGGRVGGELSADTWEWDPDSGWELRATDGPDPRQKHAMVYDAARGQTLLIGGQIDVDHVFEDTWSWDGSTWTQLSATTPPRFDAAVAFDEARQVVVLHGGNAPVFSDETWEWDGATWTLRGTGLTDANHAMAYDPEAQVTVLFGSARRTQVWDGQSWTELSAVGPSAREGHRMVYDERLGQVLLHGGFQFQGTRIDTEVWSWDGGGWRRMDDIGPALTDHLWVYDPERARSVLVGNSTDNTLWEYGEVPLGIVADPLQRGATTEILVAGAAPGETVFLGLSTAGVGEGPCPPAAGGTCLDLLQPVLAGSAVADDGCLSTLSLAVPAELAANQVGVQALSFRSGGEPALKSDPVLLEVSD